MPWKPRPFHKSEKLDPHLSRRPRSCLRAHTNKREPSFEAASLDGGFEMALTAVEAMAAAGTTGRCVLHESSRRNTDRRDSEARPRIGYAAYPDDGIHELQVIRRPIRIMETIEPSHVR